MKHLLLSAILLYSVYGACKYPDRQIKIQFLNSHIQEKMDLEMFEKLFQDRKSFTTISPYDSGLLNFEGVSLEKVIEHFYPKKPFKFIQVKATDGYTQRIEKASLKNTPYLAFKTNKEYMTTKNRGTFRVVYNYGNTIEASQKKTDPMWVWSIVEIQLID